MTEHQPDKPKKIDRRPEWARGYDASNKETRSPNHGKRGPDKRKRQSPKPLTMESKYKTRMGREIWDDMRSQMRDIEEFEVDLLAINDPSARLAGRKTLNDMKDKYAKTWLPYIVAKRPVAKTEKTEDDQVTLDELLDSNSDIQPHDPGYA